MMFDVTVVGGSYAGMSAALQVARARRRVLVLDSGKRRNRFAASSHGFLAQDGRAPDAIAADARAQLLAYPTVTWRDTPATAARATTDGFVVSAGGEEHQTKRIVLASGVVDELPDIPGLKERWGKTVVHCPYCHGYEFGMGALGVLATSPASIHHALLVPDWAAPGATTFFLNGFFEPDSAQLASLAARGVAVERDGVVRVEGEGREIVVGLRDGRTVPLAGLFVAPRMRIENPLPAQLGCSFEEGPLGAYLKTDAMFETTVRGVFACGDIATPAGTVANAVGGGARAGASAHRSIVFPS